jgi:hypothetical protein
MIQTFWTNCRQNSRLLQKATGVPLPFLPVHEKRRDAVVCFIYLDSDSSIQCGRNEIAIVHGAVM